MVQMVKEIHEQPLVLENCKMFNEKVITDIVSVLNTRSIDFVVIAARGTSDHAGVYAKYIIEYALGIPVALAAPSIFTVYKKDMKFQNCLVIGISQSGKAADVLEVIKNANSNGAVTVSISNDLASPLAQEAAFHLFCNAGLEKSVAATKTFLTEIYLIAQLVAKWSGNKAMEDELSLVPGNITKLFETSRIIASKAERYRYINDCFVLTRGINYAVALEFALKIQETTYVRAKAYATSDFYHGPYAMIEKDMPVIVIAPEGPALNDIISMIDRLKSSNVELIIISNNKDVLKMGSSSFEIPYTSNDLISPFYNVVVAQLFACHLALTKGLNPDAPRGLKKVTITK